MFIKSVYTNKKICLLYLSFSLLVLGLFVLPSKLEVCFIMVFFIFITASGHSAWLENDRDYLSSIVIFPICLSAVQNLYLGLAAYRITKWELQILLSMNIAVACIEFVLVSRSTILRKKLWVQGVLIVLLVYMAVLYFMYPATVTAFLASVRNMISPVIFFGVSYFMGKKINDKKMGNYLRWISTLVVLIGLMEYVWGVGFWKCLNIGQLWELKGIGVNVLEIPYNWFSSERINGHYLRRMVSSFADPVNLGTFLFGIFLAAWYRKERLLELAIVVCCILTVSKGALIGYLIFFVVYFWYMDRTKISAPIIVSMTASIAVAFLYYSKVSSSGSVTVHLNGFINALTLPIKYPFGIGVGNVGVLASVFGSKAVYDTGVTETGIGKIIAELGVVGILVYMFFFYKLYRIPFGWKSAEKRKYILFYTLLFSIIVNMMFNEVALSPNSCGIYFLLLGRLATLEK